MVRKLLLGLLLLAPLSAYPFLRDSSARTDPLHNTNLDNGQEPTRLRLSKNEELALHTFSIFSTQPFPASIPWETVRLAGEQESELEKLAKSDPVAFLEKGMERYKSNVEGYRVTFLKQEKVKGKMRPKERIIVNFREKPFSVHMDWKQGAGKAVRTLYVEGKNDGMMRARPTPVFGLDLGIWSSKIDSADCKAASRFPVSEFGIYFGAKSTVDAMKAARERDKLFVRYEGIQRVEQLGNSLCYKFVRYKYDPPESAPDANEDVNELIIYLDTETLMQTGSVLKDGKGALIAEYFFHNVEINPTFSEKQFTDGAL